MADLSMMQASLQQMRQHIWPSMDALHKGAPEEAAERNRRMNELESIAKRLKIMIRDINSAQHLQDARASGLHKIPPGSRYGAAQAIQQRQHDLAALRKQAEDLAAAVRELLDKNGFLSPAQKAMKLNELVENFAKAVENQHALSELGIPNVPVIKAPHDATSVTGLAPILIFIYLAIQKYRKKT